MRVHRILICLLLLQQDLMAQNPGSDDSIMSIKRNWTKSSNVVVGPDPALKANQFNFIYKKLDSISQLVKQAYPVPTGSQADWHCSIRGYPLFPGGPSP